MATLTSVMTNTFNEEEQQLRRDLAACYRLFALYGWDDLVYTHISCRLPGTERHFLINPYGMMFDEITASSLVKIDNHGEKVDDSQWPVNPAGFIIHNAIHQVRDDVCCVLHSHSVATVAVSVLDCGLLPLTQHAMFVHHTLSYHDYEGPSVDPDECQRLQDNMGKNNVMFLRNHGVLVTGETVADAFQNFYFTQRACEMQIQAMSCGESLVAINPKVIQGAFAKLQTASLHQRGKLIWPGLLRRLDRTDQSWRD